MSKCSELCYNDNSNSNGNLSKCIGFDYNYDYNNYYANGKCYFFDNSNGPILPISSNINNICIQEIRNYRFLGCYAGNTPPGFDYVNYGDGYLSIDYPASTTNSNINPSNFDELIRQVKLKSGKRYVALSYPAGGYFSHIYSLVSDTLIPSQQLSANLCSPITTGKYTGNVIGCGPRNSSPVCTNRTSDTSYIWALYDMSP